jgi:hypothetical protein
MLRKTIPATWKVGGKGFTKVGECGSSPASKSHLLFSSFGATIVAPSKHASEGDCEAFESLPSLAAV